MPRIDQLWYDIEARTADFEAGIARSKTGLADFTAYIKANPMAVLGGLTVALSAAGAAAAKMAADLEYEMKKVQVITKGSSDELRALRDGVLELYKSTSVGSLDELTAGLQDIVGAGIEAGKSLEFLRVATEAAVGGATTVDVATSALLTLLANYEKTGLTVEQISDKMFRAVDVGRMSFEDLASTIGKVAPLTAQYDISLDDLLGTLAQLTVNGLSTAEAVTAIRSAIVNIISPTGKLATEAPKLAAAFNADRLRRDGFAVFLSEFKVAAEASGIEIQSLLGDVQGLIGALSLLGDGGVGAKEKIDSLATSAGATRDAFNEMSASAKAVNAVMENQLKGTLIDLGESLLPWWNGVLLKVIETIDAKRAAILRLRAAMLEINELQGAQMDAGQLSLARRKVDPSQGGTANSFNNPIYNSIPGAQFARPAVLGLEALLRNPNGLGKIDESATALATLLMQFDEVGREAFAGMKVPEMERLAAELDAVRQNLPRGKDADDVGALAENLRAVTVAAKEAAAAAALVVPAPAAGAGGGKPKGETPAERKARLAAEKKAAKDAEQELEATGRKLDAAARQLQATWDAAAKTAAAFAESQATAEVQATATGVDDLELALRRYIEAADDARGADPLGFDDAAHQRRLAAFRQQIDGVKALETVQKQASDAEAVMADIARRRSAAAADGVTNFAPSKNDVAKLETWRGTLRTIADDTRRTDAERDLAARVLLQIESELAGIHQDQNRKKKLISEQTEKIAQQTLMLARGAISAADAFGVMQDKAAKTAQEVVNMVEGVSKLAANPGDVGAWVQTIGAGLNLAADAIGLGDAMDEKKARKANRDAIDRLTEFADVLAVAITNLQQFTGAAIDGVSDAARFLAEQTVQLQGGSQITNVDETLRAFGTTVEEATAIAKAHGVDLDGTVDSYRRLNEAMQLTRAKFTEFGTGLDDARANQDLFFKAFGMKRGPQDALTDLLVAGHGASQDLGAQLLGAFSTGGVGGLRTELQELVRILGPGGASLDPKLLGTMTPEQFRRYISDLLDAIGAVEEDLAPKVVSAAERLNSALASLQLSWELLDVDDPAERFAQVTAAITAMDPALAKLANGLDLTTKDGIDAFGERVAEFARKVDDGSVSIEGFTTDQITEALKSWESASDAAAAGIRAAAGEVSRLFDDLDVRRLKAQGDEAGADILSTEKRGNADLATAKELLDKGLITQEKYDELAEVIGLEIANAISRHAPAVVEDEAGKATSRGSGSVIATAGAQSVDLLIGIANTELALHRQGNDYLAAIARAMQVGPMPQLQPPLASAVFAGSGGRGGGRGGGDTNIGTSITIPMTLNFWAPVTGGEEVRAAVRAGGADVAAELQRRVDNQMRVEGRPEAR